MAVQMLHDKNIWHCDASPWNVLFKSVEKEKCDEEKERLVIWHKNNERCIIIHHVWMKFVDAGTVRRVNEADKASAPCQGYGGRHDLKLTLSVMDMVAELYWGWTFADGSSPPKDVEDLKQEIAKAMPFVQWHDIDAREETKELKNYVKRLEQIKKKLIGKLQTRREPLKRRRSI